MNPVSPAIFLPEMSMSLCDYFLEVFPRKVCLCKAVPNIKNFLRLTHVQHVFIKAGWLHDDIAQSLAQPCAVSDCHQQAPLNNDLEAAVIEAWADKVAVRTHDEITIVADRFHRKVIEQAAVNIVRAVQKLR